MSFTRRVCGWTAIGLALSLAAALARGEEFVLKDGQKISGTIVGYENGMFRVETEFGFALIRKDRVASINLATGNSKGAAQKGGERAPSNAGAGPAAGERENPAARVRPSTDRAAQAAANVPAPPSSHPLDAPLPAKLQEHEEGTTYFSDTFHFAMYKPPGWKIDEELPGGKVPAIVVLESEDEQTLLFVDRQVWSGEPDLRDDVVESNLRRTYRDYKKISESESRLDGRPAVRRAFTGVIEGVEWHGVSVRVAQGSTVFGIIGLTSAETYQFQEAVLNKIINSFHLSPPSADPSSAPQAF